jgi:microcompartment protein CcmK/EutM
MNRVLGYAGVTIRTNRIEESLHFYCEGLGLKLIEKREEKAVVSTPEGELVAADQVGAGTGDKVLLVTGTVASRFCMEAPVDAAVVAILDPEK